MVEPERVPVLVEKDALEVCADGREHGERNRGGGIEHHVSLGHGVVDGEVRGVRDAERVRLSDHAPPYSVLVVVLPRAARKIAE